MKEQVNKQVAEIMGLTEDERQVKNMVIGAIARYRNGESLREISLEQDMSEGTLRKGIERHLGLDDYKALVTETAAARRSLRNADHEDIIRMGRVEVIDRLKDADGRSELEIVDLVRIEKVYGDRLADGRLTENIVPGSVQIIVFGTPPKDDDES